MLQCIFPVLIGAVMLLGSITSANAAVTAYIDSDAFLSALSTAGLSTLQEGFEDPATWGSVRTTIVDGRSMAPHITSQRVTWTANNPNSEVTTSEGAAHTGTWGFYSYPHGNYASAIGCDVPGVCGDGFFGTGEGGLLAIGMWVRTNTPYAKVGLFLDGIGVDFGEDGNGESNAIIGTGAAFFGAIDLAGFDAFEFREREGTLEDQKLIFADDASFVLMAVPLPPALLLFASGLAVIIGVARRRS